VATIQSTNPALISGTIDEHPSPAGVRAPERLMPMVTSGSSIFAVNSWQASRSRPELYARKASSTMSDSFSRPVRFFGRTRLPDMYLSRFGHAFFFSQSGISDRSFRYRRCEGCDAVCFLAM